MQVLMQVLRRKTSSMNYKAGGDHGEEHHEHPSPGSTTEQVNLLDGGGGGDVEADDHSPGEGLATPPRNKPFFLVQAVKARTRSIYTTLIVVGMAIFGISMFLTQGESHDLGTRHSQLKTEAAAEKKTKKEKTLPFPVIEYEDEGAPAVTSSAFLHASDILVCKESVVSFVINATDGKDECDGLKRAFDKTCNSDEDITPDDQQQPAATEATNEESTATTTEVEMIDENGRRRRRMTTIGDPSRRKVFQHDLLLSRRKFLLLFAQTHRWIYQTFRNAVWPTPLDFYAETEVADSYSHARYLVENNLDDLMDKRRILIQREPFDKSAAAGTTDHGNVIQQRLNEIKRNTVTTTGEAVQDRLHVSTEQGIMRQQQTLNSASPATTNKAIPQHREGRLAKNDVISATTTSRTTVVGESVRHRLNEVKDNDDATAAASDNTAESAESVTNLAVQTEAEASNSNTTDALLPSNQTVVKEVKRDKPMASLTLPTTKQHVSSGMLGETLLLQKEDSAINAALLAATNSSLQNKTAPTREAAVEAAASQKAVHDATNAVTAVLNDPTTVEARTCCASILNVFHENCDAPVEEIVSDRKLFMIVFVIALCGVVKSLIRNYEIRWLPEAAGCILVGVVVGAVISFVPHYDVSFDGDWFLRIMVPPIVFEAALSIDKKSFNRHVIPISIYAVIGTLMATGITAFIMHKGTLYLQGFCETIPYVEALLFGSLISSIDPIAVLSVLSNMGMTDTDTIFVVIFGESLLNDGVAIVLFQTLVHFLDESLVIDSEAVVSACIHFFVVALGSLAVGIGSGLTCTAYYWAMQGCQTPLVEVLLFFCWAFTPYYICDGVGWSGIVSVVATGFVMDLFVVGQAESSSDEESVSSKKSESEAPSRPLPRRTLFNPHGHLSVKAKMHVGFVAEILATMMETAIFAYLGVFLFSYRYHWNVFHTMLSIFACCLSRGIMIPVLSMVANWITKTHQSLAVCDRRGRRGALANAQAPSGVIVDGKMQLVLWVAGLRGAMSFALVEYIPLYDTVTGEGTRVKGELKAMTSATIIFTVFILGGYTYYLMEHLGMTPNQTQAARAKRGSSVADLSNHANQEDLAEHRPFVRQRK